MDRLSGHVGGEQDELALFVERTSFCIVGPFERLSFAVEVDDETFKKNEDMFLFLTTEAEKRGIFVIQMFYNILLSKPFADHYGLKTQDRNRPITPLVSDYTRKSVAAFIENILM